MTISRHAQAPFGQFTTVRFEPIEASTLNKKRRSSQSALILLRRAMQLRCVTPSAVACPAVFLSQPQGTQQEIERRRKAHGKRRAAQSSSAGTIVRRAAYLQPATKPGTVLPRNRNRLAALAGHGRPLRMLSSNLAAVACAAGSFRTRWAIFTGTDAPSNRTASARPRCNMPCASLTIPRGG